jgi:hypothetical protein
MPFVIENIMPNNHVIATSRAAVASQLGFFSSAQANHDAVVSHNNSAATAHAFIALSQIGLTTPPQPTPPQAPSHTLQPSAPAA